MTTLSRRHLLSRSITAAAVMLTMTVATPVQPAWADEDADLRQPLIDLHAGLESAMRAGRSTPFITRFEALAPVVDRAFDLDTVLRASIGVRWGAFDEKQRERLAAAYQRFTVATYVANFDKYDGERFALLPGVRSAGTDRIVRSEIIVDPGDDIRLDYVMRNFGSAWRAVDVLIDGTISRVAVQRSDFRTILANGDAEALIKSLQRKISDLSDGALNA